MKIRAFESGMRLNLPLLIARVTRGVTSNSEPYLTIGFQDNSGEIDGKLWKVSAQQQEAIKTGLIGEVSVEVIDYRQGLQLRVHDVQIKDQSLYNLQDFVKSGKYETDYLKKTVASYVERVEDPILKALVEGSLQEVGEAFYQYPAATRNHHDFVGGLATHVVGMLQAADALCGIYDLYNLDLLITGIIIHDMGKVDEYTAPLLSEYSTEGKLLGHISIEHANFVKVASRLNLEHTEQAMMLRHMILSHHGLLEYGSPVVPMFKEAELLNILDNLDARTNMFEKVYADLNEGEFSTRVFALENRNFYKAKGVK